MANSEIQYVYQKKRNEFGRPCFFTDKGPELIDDFPSDPTMLENYLEQKFVSRETQHIVAEAAHEINTWRAEYRNIGVDHTEGGWPKDMNIHDEEITKRYRRKIEKEENYNPSVMNLLKNVEGLVMENNAINIYQMYFSDCEKLSNRPQTLAKVVNLYQQPSTDRKPITNISWCGDNRKFAASYSPLEYQAKMRQPANACIWDITNPSEPLFLLIPKYTTAVCVEFHPKDYQTLISGHLSGKIAIWDLRRGHHPIDVTKYQVSHEEPVMNILWITSKGGTEFFTSSIDGYCKWWDVRKFNEPLETLLIAPVHGNKQETSEAMGVTSMEYDTSVPTKFMVGTEQGTVVSCNRKGKSLMDKLPVKYEAHFGPVVSIKKNPGFSKNFLTAGDWSVKIFSEECRESPIIWSNYHQAAFTDCSWSSFRPSVFFTTRSDGVFSIWDLLHQQCRDIFNIKVCDEELTKMRLHQEEKLIAVGNAKGNIYMLELSEELFNFSKNDKTLLTSMFERETRREKILEARGRELRLKWRTKHLHVNKEEPIDENNTSLSERKAILMAEQDYYEVIEQERKKNNSDVVL